MKARYPYAISAALAAIASIAPAAGAQVTSYGSGCPGDLGQLATLSATNEPLVGLSTNLQLSATPLSMGIVIAGLSNTTWSGFGLPLALDFIGLPGCELLASVGAQVPFVTDASGTLNLPVNFTSTGQHIYLQAYAVDTQTLTFGGMTAGLEMQPYLPGGSVPGSVIVTEFMSRPSFQGASAANGEWVELHNTTSAPIDVEGWALRDDDFDGALMLASGAGIVIPADGYIVVGVSADLNLNGGISMAVVVNNYFLSNSSDEIILTDSVGNEIDRVEYTTALGWPSNQLGASVSLKTTALDTEANDLLANWELSSCTIVGLGASCNPDMGTPGRANDDCVTVSCP